MLQIRSFRRREFEIEVRPPWWTYVSEAQLPYKVNFDIMDKSWIKARITSKTFKDGVKSFIDFARVGAIRGSISCPCLKCCNAKWLDVETVHLHLLSFGFLIGYTTWIFHGEHEIPSQLSQPSNLMETFPVEVEDDISGMIRDALGKNPLNLNSDDLRETRVDGDTSEANRAQSNSRQDNVGADSNSRQGNVGAEDIRYKKLLEECEKELYPGCKYSNLSFTLHLYHIKCIGDISNKAFNMLLELLGDTFPHLTLPSSSYEAKKLTNDLGLGYQKIDACPNDCMLYWGDRKNQRSCHICNVSRYKSGLEDEKGQSSKSHKSKKPAKILRYFPLIPRLKRLYMCAKTAEEMRWHDTGLTKDGKLRHPADGLSWKAFNARYPEFASDPHSVRLGLASDGFNPFRTMSTSHSTWPVLLIPYNLPPWICMKQYSFILSAIIPGGKGPGNDIDVYMRPLIDELKSLWEGVDAYDAFSKQRFEFRASLLWTVSDFPAYANLSGWSTKGRVACPVCAGSTSSDWLTYGKKFCYMGHRRWLEKNHKYRFQKECFDGTVEKDGPPPILTGSHVLQQLRGVSFEYGKSVNTSKKRKRNEVKESHDELSAFEDATNFIDVSNELELLFPPGFFTIMVHLTIHLISEAKLGGPVHYRWMYPIERYLMTLKSYVRNKAQPEGSIAGGYIKEECLTFCSRYFESVETLFNRAPRNYEDISGKEMYMLNFSGRKLGKAETIELDDMSLAQAHRYVLLNHYKIQPLRDRFFNEHQSLRSERIDMKTKEKLFVEEFSWWLQQQAPNLERNQSDQEVVSLAMGPNTYVNKYKGFIINGFRFLTKRREEFRKTQNFGVMVEAEEGCYYGKLTDIIELEYLCQYKVVLFRCDWIDIRPLKGLKKDKYEPSLDHENDELDENEINEMKLLFEMIKGILSGGKEWLQKTSIS